MNKTSENQIKTKQNSLNQTKHTTNDVSYITYFSYIIIITISIYTYPNDWNSSITSIQHVWYYGWITGFHSIYHINTTISK